MTTVKRIVKKKLARAKINAGVYELRYLRAFHFSSWNVSPVKISLLLNSIVQVPRNDDLNIFGEDMSTLKLVYYNPDNMVIAEEVVVEEPPPSIFDIY